MNICALFLEKIQILIRKPCCHAGLDSASSKNNPAVGRQSISSVLRTRIFSLVTRLASLAPLTVHPCTTSRGYDYGLEWSFNSVKRVRSLF